MMILSLEMENVKSYENALVEFTPGVNAIVGHNGAGKSTIVEAIGFTLFGALNYNQAEFIRAGAKSAKITVAILSGADERRYEVTRRIGSSSQIYIQDPELQVRICEGRADVERFLYEHLGLEPGTDLTALFKDAVGVPQGTLTAAFLYSDANRRPIFDRLLQLEDYKTASDKLREPLRLLRERRGDLDTQIAGARGRLERLPDLLAEVAADKASLTQREAKRNTAQAAVSKVTAQRQAMEVAQAEATAAQQAFLQAQQQAANLKQQLDAAQAALCEAESAQEIVAANQAGAEAYETASAEQTRLEAETQAQQQLKSQLTQVDQQIALSQSTLARIQEDMVEIEAAEATVATLTSRVQEQESLEAQLGTAQQEAARLDDAQQRLRQVEESTRQLQTRREELRVQLQETARLDEERTAKSGALEGLRDKIDARREELARMKAQADAIKEQTEVLQQEFALCPVCEQPLEEAQRRLLLERNGAQITEMRTEYSATQTAMKAEETEVKSAQSALDAIQTALRRAPRPEELARVEDELAAAQRARQETETIVNALKGATETIERVRGQLARLGNPKQHYAVAAARAGQKDAVVARRKATTTELAGAQGQAEKLNKDLARFAHLEEAVGRVRRDLQTHLEAYRAVLANRQLAGAVDARRAAVDKVAAESTRARAARDELEQAAAAAAARFDAGKYEALREEEQKLRTELGVLEAEAKMVGERLARQEAEAATLQALAKEMAQLESRQKALLAQERVLEKIRTLLRQAQPYIAAALVRRISEQAAQIFGDIMQDYSRHLQWGEDYGVTLRVDGHDRQFAQLSGGEQMSAALAVRLALLREMSNIDVAFFDEPTTNLDETRRESLARQILQVRGFRQLFVISHDDTFEQATQNVVRVERLDGSSRVYYG